VVLATELPTELFTAAFRDNVELTYLGIRFGDLTTAQQCLLVDVLRTYVGRIRDGHAAVRLEEVTRHTVVRTPNGNDYGCDLLRQHHARFDHARPDHRHG
jgi:hypothetical protein